MGNTTASTHIAWRGPADLAVTAIVRSYGKLGYKRVKKRPAEGGKHVVLVTRAGQPFVSVYDSNNASLDSGELKDLAQAASKALKTAAVFTSLYDSDSYEFIVFARGRQLDLLMTEAESYEGPMKRMSDKSRAAHWSSLFGRAITGEQINQALAQQTVFADHMVAGISNLIGLSGGQPQMNYQDFFDGEEETTAELYFVKKPQALALVPVGTIRLADYFDPDNCRMRSVYPAAWPIAVGVKRRATWLILSQGTGFSGGTATTRLEGPDSMVLSRAIISGCKFHNGQVVGPLEPVAPNLTQADVQKLVESKRFALAPVESSGGPATLYRGEFPHLVIPSITPDRTTQILVILQIDLEPKAAGEWELEVTIQPGTQTEYQHRLPPLRIAAVEQTWLPVISGLNAKTRYDKSNLSSTHLRELEHRQSQVQSERQLDYPAVTSSVAILEDEGQPTLDACKAWLETWLRPLAEQQVGEIAVKAEKQMSGVAYVGKTKKRLPVSGFLADKLWAKLFDSANDYQTVTVSFVPKDAECPIAGIGLQHSFNRIEGMGRPVDGKHVANSLSAMRRRPFDIAPLGATWHVFKWVINHERCYEYLRTSAGEMDRQLDSFAAERPLLQAWSSQQTWIPEFDRADDFERTIYEEAGVLNWFRGILTDGGGLNDDKMTAQWCRNVLRMVAPRMWLCRNLFDQVNKDALERVAEVSESNGVYRVALRSGYLIDELELALLPILPVESARISVL